MAHSNQILDELNNLSALVANLPAESPYQAPAGYFDNFAADLLTLIPTTEQAAPDLLAAIKHINPFELPGGYFDQFAGDILKRIKAEEAHSSREELKYLSPLLLQLNKKIPFNLPENYFKEFPSDIMSGVNAVDFVNQELESSAPITNNPKIKNAYQVPEGYFDDLDQELLTFVKQKKKAALVPINTNKNISRYAMAALVAGLISIAALVFFKDNKPASSARPLADIEQISSDELINYLENIPSTPIELAGMASYTMREEDVQELLADLPDEELQQYLETRAVSRDLTFN